MVRDLLPGRRMMFIYLLLFGNFISSIKGGIASFGLASGQTPLAGSKIKLQCITNGPETTYRIFKNIGPDTAMTVCVLTNRCIPSYGEGYMFSISSNIVTIEIEKLERSKDETTWTCKDASNKGEFDLTVYDVPSSIILDGVSHACDLGTSTCQFTCKTNGCTYPAPQFSWFYSNNNGEPAAFPKLGNVENNSQINSCTSSAKNYQQTLTLAMYTVFSGNVPMTIQLQCKMQISNLPSVTRTSEFSRDVVFAVKVSTVSITDGGINLPDGELIVSENEPKSLACTPGYGHPDSTVTWYIEGKQMATGQVYSLDPLNSFHGQQIYCVADNIPSNRINDTISSKHALFVTVKTQYVYIEPAENNDLLVIENKPEPVVCISSPGRPRSIIKWFKQSRNIGEGNETHFESTADKLEVTKSTRYFSVSRVDSGWILSCSASNFGGSGRIEANNSKSFSILYAPEHMSIALDGVAVDGPTIDVIKGNARTLKCEAFSNPPASVFYWDNNSIQGNTFTIDSSIQNNQVVNCTAKNKMTTSSGTTVYGYDSISKTINLQYGAVIERLEVNGDAHDTAIINENDPIFIACYVDSNPFSNINLFRGSSPLTAKERGTELTYNISSAQCSHTSPYICKARNGIPNVEQPAMKTVQINVECSPRLATDTDSLVSAQENTSAVLSLTILAYPIPTKYDWHRNTSNEWKEVTNSTSIQMTQASLQFNLTLISVKPEDYGEYKLTAENGIGDPFNFTFILKANGEPLKPASFILLRMRGTGLIFYWEQGFNGGHTQTFWIQVTESHKDNWENKTIVDEFDSTNYLGNGSYLANITGMNPGTYSIRLIAANIKGQTEPVKLRSSVTIYLPDRTKAAFPVGAAVGGGVGATALIILGLIIFTVWKKRSNFTLTKGCKAASERKADDLRLTEQSYDSLSPQRNSSSTYEKLTIQNQSDTQRSAASEYDDLESETTNKHIYTGLQAEAKAKPNTEKVAKQRMYDNTRKMRPKDVVDKPSEENLGQKVAESEPVYSNLMIQNA